MGLASNATGRLHTPALDKLQEVIFQQNGNFCSSFFTITITADGISDGHKTTTRPGLHSLCTTPEVLIATTIMQRMKMKITLSSCYQDPPERARCRRARLFSLQVLWTSSRLDGL